MVGWHQRLNGHESEQTPRDGEGQGSLVCYNPWGLKDAHDLVTEQQQQTQNNGHSLSHTHTHIHVHTRIVLT